MIDLLRGKQSECEKPDQFRDPSRGSYLYSLASNRFCPQTIERRGGGFLQKQFFIINYLILIFLTEKSLIKFNKINLQNIAYFQAVK